MKQPFCAPAEALRRVLDAAAALPRPAVENVLSLVFLSQLTLLFNVFSYALIITRGYTLSIFFHPQFPDCKTFPHKIIRKQ